MTIGTSDWLRSQRARSSPLSPGQHQIQHHQLVVPGGPGAPRLPRVAHGGHPELVAFQKPAEQIADLAVVVHHQDVRHLFSSAQDMGSPRAGAAAVAFGCISSRRSRHSVTCRPQLPIPGIQQEIPLNA